MIGFERRQNILRILAEKPGIRVTQLAEQLAVSEGTIRNDLTALKKSSRYGGCAAAQCSSSQKRRCLACPK